MDAFISNKLNRQENFIQDISKQLLFKMILKWHELEILILKADGK